MGAYIGIDKSDTMGAVRVGLGDVSNISDQYLRDIHAPLSIEAALASDEVWSDKPIIVLAIQARDRFHSTIFLDGEKVFAFVRHSMHVDTPNRSCNLNKESGICSISISLEDHISWFTDSDTNVSVIITSGGTSINETVILRSAVMEDTSSDIFMNLPAHSVFSRDRIHIPIYATYDHFLLSFILNCSVDEDVFITEFTGPNTWSLITPSTGLEHHASVTGFRNDDTDNITRISTPDLLANLTVEIGSITEAKNLSIRCTAVSLLLTTRESPGENVLVNATDRQSVRIGEGLLFAEPITPVKLFAYSNINQVINTANLTGVRQDLELRVQGFYSDGSIEQVTNNLACSSEDSIIKVDSDCRNVFFDGTETASGETNITLQHNGTIGYVQFRVWLPDSPIIEVEDTTLNKITGHLDSDSPYQRTRVHVVTTLVSSGKTPIDSVYITSVVLPYLKSSNSGVLTINATTGEVVGVGAGETNITLLGNISTEVTVNDAHLVSVDYLDVFIISGIEVNASSNTIAPNSTTTVDIELLQEFSYIGSEINVVSVAVFSDGQRQVLEGGNLSISAAMSNSLDQIDENKYSIARQVNEVGFIVSWGEYMTTNGLYFNSSTPLSLEVSTSMTVTYHNDSAMLVGIPFVVDLAVFLVYENNKRVDVTLNRYTDIDLDPEGFIEVSDGNKIIASQMSNKTVSVTAKFNNDSALESQTSITVVKADHLIVSAHPFPPYEGSRNTNVMTIRKIGSSFQMVEIEVKLRLSDGSDYDITHDDNVTIASGDGWLVGSVLTVPDTLNSDSVTIDVTFDTTLVENLTLTIDTTDSLDVTSLSNITFTDDISGQNEYQIEFDVTFEENIRLNSISANNYSDLVVFYCDQSCDAIDLDETTGLIQVRSNYHEGISVCVRSKESDDVYTCEIFFANLQPGRAEIDLGEQADPPLTGPPLMMPVTVGDTFAVPVFLNLDYAQVGIFEMELAFSKDLVQFVDITQGNNWESGQIVYVEPATDDDHVTFGGILHAGVNGSRLNLATVTFRSNSTGRANFSVFVNFIASANVNVSTLTENREQNASRISLEITEGSDVMRRAADEYSANDEPPLPPPLTTHPHTHRVARLRRQIANCEPNTVVGDANGDCLVDLRDVYLLQLYIAESVFNFSSPVGQDLLQVIDEGTLDFDNDNMFTLLDVEELETITLNLAYEAELTATVEYNSTIDKCSIEISGNLSSLSRDSPPAGTDVHVVIGFSSSEQDFGHVFGNIFFTGIVQRSGFDQPYGGSIRMLFSDPKEDEDFKLDGIVDALSVSFNISVEVVVTDTQRNVHSFSSDIVGVAEALSLINLTIFPPTDNVINIPSDACIRPQPSTSSVTLSSTTLINPSSSPSISSSVTASTPVSSSMTASTSVSSSMTASTPVSSSVTASTPVSSSMTASTSVSSSVTASAPVSSSMTASTPVSQRSSSSSTSLTPLATLGVETTSSMGIASSSSVESSGVQSRTSLMSSTTALETSAITSTAALSSVQSSSPGIAQPSITSAAPHSSTQTSTVQSSRADSTQTSSTSTSIQPTSRTDISQSSTVLDSSASAPSTTTGTSTDTSSAVGAEFSDAVIPSTTSYMTDTDRRSTAQTTVSTPMGTPIVEVTQSPASSADVGAIVAAIFSVIIIALIITIVVCGMFVMVRRKKGLYPIEQSNGVHIRNSMVSDDSESYWQQAENCIVSEIVLCVYYCV